MKKLTKILNIILIPYTLLILLCVFLQFDFPGILYLFIGYFFLTVIYLLYILIGGIYYLGIMSKTMRHTRMKYFAMSFVIVTIINVVCDYILSKPIDWLILLHSFGIASLITFWDLLFTTKPVDIKKENSF